MTGKQAAEEDTIAEVFFIWESESRYVLDTLSSWVDQLEKPLVLIHVFLRKDTPDKERPKELPWIRIHETLTATHSASRTGLVAHILENYYQKNANDGGTQSEGKNGQRQRVKFAKPLYIVQEFEDQYEELISLLRGSERFSKNYDIKLVGREQSIINGLLENLDDLRHSVNHQSGKRCTKCSVDLGKELHAGKNSRRGSYYACGHELPDHVEDDDSSNQNSPRSMYKDDFDANWFSQIQNKRLSLKPSQSDELCQSCSHRRNTLFPQQSRPRLSLCVCGHEQGEGRSSRRSVSPINICEHCHGRRKGSMWQSTNGDDNELFCAGCMAALMKQAEMKKRQSMDDCQHRDHDSGIGDELCPACSGKANETESESRPPSENKEVDDSSEEKEDELDSPRGIHPVSKGAQKYYCQFCPQKVFASQGILDVHLRNSHKKCNCGCNQMFENRNEYLKHFYHVFPLGCYVVRKCPERFRSLYYQALHHKEAHFADKPFYCVPCRRDTVNNNGVGQAQKISYKDMKSLRVHGEIVGHTDEEMFLVARDVDDREDNQPKLSLRSTAINFSG